MCAISLVYPPPRAQLWMYCNTSRAYVYVPDHSLHLHNKEEGVVWYTRLYSIIILCMTCVPVHVHVCAVRGH